MEVTFAVLAIVSIGAVPVAPPWTVQWCSYDGTGVAVRDELVYDVTVYLEISGMRWRQGVAWIWDSARQEVVVEAVFPLHVRAHGPCAASVVSARSADPSVDFTFEGAGSQFGDHYDVTRLVGTGTFAGFRIVLATD